MSSKPQRSGEAEKKIRRKLADWYLHHGRDLPWRHTRDPYAILVSEFMLQQTTVTAVIPYFERWMKTFPNVATLARAEEREVFTLWQGLGYYSRARNLHRAAQAVRDLHRGKVPGSLDELRALPGVGEYTAGAVAAFAFDLPEVVVDANIARVLARLFNWQAPIDDTAGRIFLREAAQRLLPSKGGGLHVSSFMELGALVCVPRAPRCLECPVRAECQAENPEMLPVKRPRRAVEEVAESRAFVWEKGRLWLEESAGPRWRGLWLLPLTETSARAPEHVEIYPITRFRITMKLFAERCQGRVLTGFPFDVLPPMPAPHARAVAAMRKKGHT